MLGRRPRKLTDAKDIEKHWEQAFPDPEPPTYSRRGVQIGMAVGAILLGGLNFYFVADFFAGRYGDLQTGIGEPNQEAAEAVFWILLIASSPGIFFGGALGAFLGAKLGPRE